MSTQLPAPSANPNNEVKNSGDLVKNTPPAIGSKVVELYNDPTCRQKEGGSLLFDKRFQAHLIQCAALIFQDTKPRSLHFQCLDLDDQFASVLFLALHNNKQINRLQFSHCNFSSNFCTLLSTYFAKNIFQLQELSMSDCNLDSKNRHGWIAYGLASYRSLKKFELHNPNLAAHVQVSALSSQSNVQSNGKLRPLIEHYIGGISKSAGLENLDLSHSVYLNKAVCQAIAQMLSTNKQLRVLTLSNNTLADEAIEIFKALQTNTTLEQLFMNDCQCMNPEWDKETQKMREKNKTLKTFEQARFSQTLKEIKSSQEQTGAVQPKLDQSAEELPPEGWSLIGEMSETNEDDPDPNKDRFENSAFSYQFALTKAQLWEQAEALITLSPDSKHQRDTALAIAASIASDSANQLTAVAEQVTGVARVTTYMAAEASSRFLAWAYEKASLALERVQSSPQTASAATDDQHCGVDLPLFTMGRIDTTTLQLYDITEPSDDSPTDSVAVDAAPSKTAPP